MALKSSSRSSLQRLILLLGQPVYSLAIILSTMLLSSGLGSYASGRLSTRRALSRLLVVAAVVLVVYALFLPDLIRALLGMPFAVRVAAAVAVVAIPAFVMGMPFPTGLRALAEQARENSVPWVWGVNGAMSVLASVGGMILAIEFGYTVVFAAGALCYLGAALLFHGWAGRAGSAVSTG